MAVPVSVILERKGGDVVTVRPDSALSEAADTMARHNIGALVVSADGRSVDGIISERDVVRCIAESGAQCLAEPVGSLMTSAVTSCDPATTIDELMATMTTQRIRHVPVMADGALQGIVSIGDVVKSRLDELELQATTLEQYVTGSHS